MKRTILFLLACALLYTCKKDFEPVVKTEAAPIETGSLRRSSPTTPSVDLYSGLYVDRLSSILGIASKEDSLIIWAKINGFNTFSFYDLNTVLKTSSLREKLPSFIGKCKSEGIRVTGICGGESSLTRMHTYNISQSDPNKRFDAYNLELEWWNGAASFSTYSSVLRKMQGLAKSIRPEVTVEVYIGWLKPDEAKKAQADTLVKYCDRILVHDYRTSPSFSYMKSRLEIIGESAQKIGKVQSIMTIFSAEKKSWGASNDFMGNYYWIYGLDKSFNDSYVELISQYKSYFETPPMSPSTLPKFWYSMDGYQIFTRRYSIIARPL